MKNDQFLQLRNEIMVKKQFYPRLDIGVRHKVSNYQESRMNNQRGIVYTNRLDLLCLELL